VGDGPLDLVLVPGWVSQVEAVWDEPTHEAFLRRLASFSRLILFDKRGTGLSDRVSVDRLTAADSDPAASITAWTSCIRSSRESNGLGEAPRSSTCWLQVLQATRECRNWWARYLRVSASPGAAVALLKMNTQIDIRPILPTIRVPTLVMHGTGDLDIDVGGSRYIAQQIPGAKYVELPGRVHLWFVGDTEAILGEIGEFLTGVRRAAEFDRVLATVMFTDIADSTAIAANLGDSRWRSLVESHNSLVRRELDLHRGREVDSAGDGFLVHFDGPARAIRCASAIVDGAARLGLGVRAGVHTGECEMVGGKLRGVAIHIGARVMAAAAPGEVVVSSTVRDLVAGSGIQFADRGRHELKGVPGEWQLYVVVRAT